MQTNNQGQGARCDHEWWVPLAGLVNDDSLWWCHFCGAVKWHNEIKLPSTDTLAAAQAAVFYAARVMDDLAKFGARIVPHLIDSDDNDGQRLRDALARHAALISTEKGGQ